MDRPDVFKILFSPCTSQLNPYQTQNAPLSQRIQFLEAKGLSPPEIDHALRLLPQITAVVSGTVAYGAISLLKKYLFPHLKPPTATAYEQDRDALTAQFDAAEALLKEIQAETASVRAAVDEQREHVDKASRDVQAVVTEMRQGETKTRDEMREIRDEIENIREMLPKMIEKNKETQKQSLAELQQELKSLKALLLSRGPNALTSSPSTPLLAISGRPSIPSWQLANIPSALASSEAVGGSHLNGKGKQVELSTNTSSALASSVAAGGSPPTHSNVPPSSREPCSAPRLRASIAASETSTTPDRSTSPPSHRVPVTQHPLSPTSTPIPDSPTLAARLADPSIETLAGGSILPEENTSVTLVLPPQEPNDAAQPPSEASPADPQVPASLTGRSTDASDSTHIDSTADPCSKDSDTEALQERLKLVEQRFTDVSTSFKKLQVERRDIDNVISELTPLEGSKDVAALREYLVNVNMKAELSQDEVQRLNGKLTRQEERLEESRDTHRLETASQADQIEKLRQQLSEAEVLLTASQSTASQTEEENAKRDSDIEHLRVEVYKANTSAKEEEEKRVKAISLLKTVRQKLVKAEKERDDAWRELNETRDRNLEEKEKDRVERANLEREVDAVNADREKAVFALRAQFDKDIAAAKDRADRDIHTAKKQFDTEMNALKTSHSAEISARKTRISTLEHTLANLTSENKSFFEQLELRQAELESSQCHAESLQAQNTELQFQLKELRERITLLTDEVGELQGEREMRSQTPGTSTEEISQLVSSIEVKYEAKLSELKKTLTTTEKERTEAEANWSRKLTEKTKETEDLKRMLQSSVQLRERDEDVTAGLKAEIEKLQAEARSQHGRLHELQSHIDASKDAESTLHRRLSELAARTDDTGKQLEESKSREAQLRSQNKILRDELRKVQNSAAVLERQRNPGAGYWSSRSEVTDSRTSISSIPDAPSPSSPPLAKKEEEISYEYLRNVILQFLEHKEMRPNLVRVLSTILRFTPQETRRLMSKV
ncbi:hypothetical protein L210DRAFT_3610558 [Boletus edulis BED1]|uniref:Peroxisomal membrane protein PEX14 n=1 Tax=Boletus edulis BED1 TaxID=1328754 RepID=A0AAD4GJI0_BOLED|nr:hypothetical protein L210DRAFT_3610558 [Boletus edulis BED1]